MILETKESTTLLLLLLLLSGCKRSRHRQQSRWQILLADGVARELGSKATGVARERHLWQVTSPTLVLKVISTLC